MKNLLKKYSITMAAVVGLCAAPIASATSFSLGALTPDDSVAFGSQHIAASTPVSDLWSFSVTHAADTGTDVHHSGNPAVLSSIDANGWTSFSAGLYLG